MYGYTAAVLLVRLKCTGFTTAESNVQRSGKPHSRLWARRFHKIIKTVHKLRPVRVYLSANKSVADLMLSGKRTYLGGVKCE